MTIYTSIRLNAVRPSTFTWLQRVLATLDSKDLEGYLNFCSPSVTFSFNNVSPNDSERSIHAKEIARASLAQFWSNFEEIEHEELNIFAAGTIKLNSSSPFSATGSAAKEGDDGKTGGQKDDNKEEEEEEHDQFIIHEALNHYITKDGRKVTLRAVACLDRDIEGRIENVRIYSDQSPLFESS
ncbi:MAG: hypothetical protein M1823_003532 [Watsoniomyces obsoletus]|nr:MAG: hypothetical protein M1823_003532 [Watsoniomyces obsoletus]